MEQPDRVSVSFGMKVPGAQEYSSINFNVSYSSDRKKGEKLEDHWKRVASEVDTQIEGYYDRYGQLQAGEEDEEFEEGDEEGED